MRLLFISYWGIGEPLTSSTILPYLRLVTESPLVERVVLVSVERGAHATLPYLEDMPRVEHYPIYTRFRAFDALSKLDLFTFRIRELVSLVKEYGIDVIDAKGSLAGGMAYLVSHRTGVPFVVESFEPHSEYMVDCGVWQRNGVSYWVARWLEQMQKRKARTIVTVTDNYRRELISQGVTPDRIKIIPSITDTRRFALNITDRIRKRRELGWEKEVVGIYVGKFGGLYYEREAFALFELVRLLVGPHFRLILITAASESQVSTWLDEVGFPLDQVTIRFVDHAEVPQWLSAADFAFSLHRITLSSPYFSPVKNGEYWASGLPILLPRGVSDDYRVVQDMPWAGALFDPDQPEILDRSVKHLITLIETPGHRERIMQLANEIRDIRVVRGVYDEIFDLKTS
jgi:glycosyltransferase involved in cell wall biosynthesis